MKLMLLQLSDIHIASSSDSVFSKLDALAVALQSITADAYCLILSGDIALSGSQTEYRASLRFLSSIQEKLRTALNFAKLDLVIIPGNHDCDLINGPGDRTALISELSRQTAPISASQLAQGLAAQQPFFNFLALATDDDTVTTPTLYRQLIFHYGEYRLVVHCYNSAWLSDKHERQGSLLFP